MPLCICQGRAAFFCPKSAGGSEKTTFYQREYENFLPDYQLLKLVRKINYQFFLLSIKIDIPLIYQQRKNT